MTQDIPVPYDLEFQSPIPNIWRNTIVQIVEAFKDKDFARLSTIPNVGFVDIQYAAETAENIDHYGAHLVSLPEEAWDSSVCFYQGKHNENHFWKAIVDLFTEEECPSDLIINLQIYKQDDHYTYEIIDIYVP